MVLTRNSNTACLWEKHVLAVPSLPIEPSDQDDIQSKCGHRLYNLDYIRLCWLVISYQQAISWIQVHDSKNCSHHMINHHMLLSWFESRWRSCSSCPISTWFSSCPICITHRIIFYSFSFLAIFLGVFWYKFRLPLAPAPTNCNNRNIQQSLNSPIFPIIFNFSLSNHFWAILLICWMGLLQHVHVHQ